MKRLLFAFPLLLLSCMLTAQTSDEAEVRACLENYMSGEADRLEKAFHPSASMKYMDAQTGEFKDVPIADFIARVLLQAEDPRTVGRDVVDFRLPRQTLYYNFDHGYPDWVK